MKLISKAGIYLLGVIIVLASAIGQADETTTTQKNTKKRIPSSTGNFTCESQGNGYGEPETLTEFIRQHCNTSKPFSFSMKGEGITSPVVCCTVR